MTPIDPTPDWMFRTSSRLLEQLDDIAKDVTIAIREKLPSYDGTVPSDGHVGWVRDQLARGLAGLRDGTAPTRSDLAAAEQLGRERAKQGLPVSTLLEAYVVANQVLWKHFAAELRGDSRATQELVERAPHLLSFSHILCGAAADGHQMISVSRMSDDLRMRTRLLEMVNNDPDGAECIELARRLGVNPDGLFQAVALTPVSVYPDLDRVLVRLQPAAAGVLNSMFVVLSQRVNLEAVEAVARPMAEGGVLGIGQTRTGLRGARVSIGDAERALRLARRIGRDVDFADQWLLATVLADEEHLDLLDVGRQAAADNPHLADTVRAFVDAGYSVAATARLQHLHANSVAYRLERWEMLTGWHLREFDGLVRSIVAIRLAGAPTQGP